MRNRSKRKAHRKNKDKFILPHDICLNKPHADYDICIEIFISRFGHNDIILYKKNISFALLDYPYCLDFFHINEKQRGKGQGRRLMKFILIHSQIVIHTLDISLGFFEHISKDNGLPFGNSFISSSLNVNRVTIVNSCPGCCGLTFSGYKRYACPK